MFPRCHYNRFRGEIHAAEKDFLQHTTEGAATTPRTFAAKDRRPEPHKQQSQGTPGHDWVETDRVTSEQPWRETLDRITRAYLEAFRAEQTLTDMPEPDVFEHFASYCVISSAYEEEFDVADVHVGG